MKLISCYIESYGAIKKKNIVFDGNLTSVCEANGYGKTTLASFLEAMFYGMDSDRANSKDFGISIRLTAGISAEMLFSPSVPIFIKSNGTSMKRAKVKTALRYIRIVNGIPGWEHRSAKKYSG